MCWSLCFETIFVFSLVTFVSFKAKEYFWFRCIRTVESFTQQSFTQPSYRWINVLEVVVINLQLQLQSVTVLPNV